MRGGVYAILSGQKHGASGEHDSGIIQDPGVIESNQVVNALLEKRMAFFGKYQVVRDADWNGFGKDDGIDKQRV